VKRSRAALLEERGRSRYALACLAITEWNSLEQAEAFYKSKAWNDLGPQRDKAIKTIRRYVVEATK
jgi:hypothetical protein